MPSVLVIVNEVLVLADDAPYVISGPFSGIVAIDVNGMCINKMMATTPMMDNLI